MAQRGVGSTVFFFFNACRGPYSLAIQPRRFRRGLGPTTNKQRHPLKDLGRSPTPPSAALCQARPLRCIHSDGTVPRSVPALAVRDGLVACIPHHTIGAGLRPHVGERTRRWRTELCATFCCNVDLGGTIPCLFCRMCTWTWATPCLFSKLVPLPFQLPPSCHHVPNGGASQVTIMSSSPAQ